MKNIINTLIVTLIVSLIAGLTINAIWIAPVATAAEVQARETVRPIKVNAKRAIALKAAVDALEEDQELINKTFSESLDQKDFEFKINNDLVLSKNIIKVDLDQIRSMIKAGKYNEASKAIKEYRSLLKAQINDSYCWFPMGYMFKCLLEAHKNGVEWYFN